MTTNDYNVLLRTRVPGIIRPLTKQYQQIATNMLSDKEKYKTAISPNLDDTDAIITIIYTLGMLQ